MSIYYDFNVYVCVRDKWDVWSGGGGEGGGGGGGETDYSDARPLYFTSTSEPRTNCPERLRQQADTIQEQQVKRM